MRAVIVDEVDARSLRRLPRGREQGLASPGSLMLMPRHSKVLT